ncbi:transposase family Tnp2 protein, partial [Rhizoctonia solani AG-3 Rhs1AP]
MRFLRENIALCLVIPGPNEPSDYGLDQMLEPLVDELLQLQRGVRMTVRWGSPAVYQEEVVHAELTQHIADLIARIKMGGGAGIRSERNFCLYCHMQLSALSMPDGYLRQNFDYRDPQVELENAYRWKSLRTSADRKALFDLGQTRVSTKADQWKLASRILYIPLFLAMRDGDVIGPRDVPRGNQNSPSAKHQASRAKLLHQHKKKYYNSLERPDDCPNLEDCYPSRSLRFHHRQVLRFCVAVTIIDKRSITPAEIEFAQSLLESVCIEYAQNNIQLPPNFHYLMHLEEWLKKTGSVYNTHVWGMERANGILSRIKHNGKGKGVLEGTLMQHAHIPNQKSPQIKAMQKLPNRTPADDSIIEDLLVALKGGAEHAQQRGTLMAFIAQCQTAYTRLHGIQESTRLSKQSRIIDLEELDLYEIVLQFCISMWPDAGIFGPGMPERTYLAPVGMVRNHSYVEYDGIRYGAYEHSSGKGYCYGYVNGRQPVRIDRVLHVVIPGQPDIQCTCALVRPFQPPEPEPQFPWDTWATHLGVSSWAYGELGDLIPIPIHHFSGTLALFDVPMSYARYWVTVAMDSVSPERDGEDE